MQAGAEPVVPSRLMPVVVVGLWGGFRALPGLLALPALLALRTSLCGGRHGQCLRRVDQVVQQAHRRRSAIAVEQLGDNVGLVNNRVAIAGADFASDAVGVEVADADGTLAEEPDVPAAARCAFQDVIDIEVFHHLRYEPGLAVVDVDAADAARWVQDRVISIVREKLLECGGCPVLGRAL